MPSLVVKTMRLGADYCCQKMSLRDEDFNCHNMNLGASDSCQKMSQGGKVVVKKKNLRVHDFNCQKIILGGENFNYQK